MNKRLNLRSRRDGEYPNDGMGCDAMQCISMFVK